SVASLVAELVIVSAMCGINRRWREIGDGPVGLILDHAAGLARVVGIAEISEIANKYAAIWPLTNAAWIKGGVRIGAGHKRCEVIPALAAKALDIADRIEEGIRLIIDQEIMIGVENNSARSEKESSIGIIESSLVVPRGIKLQNFTAIATAYIQVVCGRGTKGVFDSVQ